MRIATYNIQNLFHRDVSIEGAKDAYELNMNIQEFETLLEKDRKQEKDLEKMRELAIKIGFHKDVRQPYVSMRGKTGKLFIGKAEAVKQNRACRLTNWNGWIKLSTLPISELATQNKARVIGSQNLDVLALQEVEDKASLSQFNSFYLSQNKNREFEEFFCIQGNDHRGLGMATMARNGYRVHSITTHANRKDVHGVLVFDKDFVEYEIITPSGEVVLLLVAHLFEDLDQKEQANTFRIRQAEIIAQRYATLRGSGFSNIAIMGTFGAPFYNKSLSPLLSSTNLKDVSKHQCFTVDTDFGQDATYYSLGAYQMGVNIKQQDYLLLSPRLFKRVKHCGLNRKGIWSEKKPLWKMYPSLKSQKNQASSHPLLWADIDIS